MAREIISPQALVDPSGIMGTVLNFSGDSTIAIQDLSDGKASTGAHIISNNGGFDFIFGISADLNFKSEDCTFRYQLELLGGGTKSTVTVSIPGLVGQQSEVGTFQGAASAGTIIEHTLPSDINPSLIVNTSSDAQPFRIIDSTGDTKISEVALIINRPGGGKIILKGELTLTEGKVTL